MAVGLGTGSTVAHLLPALAARELTDPLRRHLARQPSGQARELGLPVEPFDRLDRLDIAIDGADQVAPDGWLVKGGGGAHTREKIVAAAAERFVVIVDSSKPVDGAQPRRSRWSSRLRPALDPPRARRRRAPRRAAEPRRRRDRRLRAARSATRRRSPPGSPATPAWSSTACSRRAGQRGAGGTRRGRGAAAAG